MLHQQTKQYQIRSSVPPIVIFLSTQQILDLDFSDFVCKDPFSVRLGHDFYAAQQQRNCRHVRYIHRSIERDGGGDTVFLTAIEAKIDPRGIIRKYCRYLNPINQIPPVLERHAFRQMSICPHR